MTIKKGEQLENIKIRTRFAPSPTGPLHVGGARTALFNYLFAKKSGGNFILRIEDTDIERSKLEWVQEIINELKWLGIKWDEGPDIDGRFGPYKQSQRTEIYKKYLQKLLDENNAYYCFCSPEELEAKRQDHAARGLAPKYDGKCRNISPKEVEENIRSGKRAAIRFKVKGEKVKFRDLIRGEIEFDASLLGDIVIAKNVETPLYHFAVVVDDFEMQISHVIRGEEHLSNTPRQILLQEALGFDGVEYAHIPLILNPDKSKMSKRAGDTAVLEYRKQGYLPESMVNFMALLGWNPGTEKEIFSLKELEKEFSLEKTQKSGAVFNVQKLDSINGIYIKEKTASHLTDLCLPYLVGAKLLAENGQTAEGEEIPRKNLEKIIETAKPRMKKLSDVVLLCDFFFGNVLEYDKNLLVWQKMEEQNIRDALLAAQSALSEINAPPEYWNEKNIEKKLLTASEKFNSEKGYPAENRGYLLWPLRAALSGKKASPGPFEIAHALGKEQTLKRIQFAIDKFY